MLAVATRKGHGRLAMKSIRAGWWVVVSALVASCGSEDLVTRAFDDSSAIAELRCRCPESGSMEQCLEDARARMPSEERQDCYRAAVAAHPDVEAWLACVVEAQAGARSCFAEASEDCSTAVDASAACGRRVNEGFAACPERSDEGTAAYLACERSP